MEECGLLMCGGGQQGPCPINFLSERTPEVGNVLPQAPGKGREREPQGDPLFDVSTPAAAVTVALIKHPGQQCLVPTGLRRDGEPLDQPYSESKRRMSEFLPLGT